MPGDNAVVRIISRLGVDYSQAIASAKLFSTEVAKLDDQLKALKVTAADLGRISGTRMSMAQQLETLSGKAKMTVQDYFDSTERRARQHKSFLDKTFSAGYFAHHLNWLATATAIGAVMAPFYEAKKVVVDLSASMTKLKQVLEIVPPYDKSPEKLAKDLEELKEVAGIMAQAYGVEFAKVIDVMSQAGRRFKDVASIVSATDTALQLVLVDAVPLETAIGSVEAIMSQFGLTTGQAKQALFEISAAAHTMQVTATDLLEAIGRSGSAFKTMKGDTKEAVAAISVLSQMTAQSGSMIGNAWKSLEASFASEKGQKALEELGISIFDSNGQLEDMSKILLELQEKWQTLSDRAKMHYATTLAGGKFHYQRLEAFLSDYTKAYQKALAGIEKANAEMQKKLVEAAMTSLPQQLKMTEASVQVLADALLKDFTPAMIIFLANLREGINSLKDHKDAINTLLRTGMRLVEAYVLWKVGLATYNAVVKSATLQTGLMQGSLLKLELTARGVPATMAAVAGSIGGVATAAIGAAAKVAGFLAVLGGISRVTGYLTDENAQKIKDLQLSIQNLDAQISGYSPLKNLKLTVKDILEGHYLEATSQLGEAMTGWLPKGSYKTVLEKERERLQGELDAAIEEKRKADEEALKRDLENLDSVLKKYESEANLKTEEMLKRLKDELPTIDFTGEDGGKSALSDFADKLTDAISQLDLANKQYEASLAKTGSLLSINASEYDYLTGKIEAGTATAEDYARAQELVGVKIALLQQEQNQLHQANEKYRGDVASLNSVLEEATRQYEAFKAAGDTEHMEQAARAVSQLQDKIQELTSKVYQNSASWWENQRAIMEAKQALNDDYFERLISWMQHEESVGRLTTKQYIEYLETLDKAKLSLEDLRRVEKDTYDHRKQMLQEQMDAVTEAYNKRLKQIEDEIAAEEEATQKKKENLQEEIDAIEEETNAKIAAIQALMDALDIEDEQFDREEAERQHNQKIADLQREYQYHALRTGLEHQQKMADIQKQIAEEEHDWELQKQEWARQDQKKAYQDQIDALKEEAKIRKSAIQNEIDELEKASDTKKKMLQKYYNEIQDLMDESNLNMLASLSLYGDRAVEKVEDILKRMQEAIEKNKLSLLPGLTDELSNVVSSAQKTQSTKTSTTSSGSSSSSAPTKTTSPVAVFSANDYINKNGTTYAWARDIARQLGLSVSWDPDTLYVTIGSKKFTPDFIQDDKAYLGLRRVGEAFGYKVTYDNASGVVSYFPKAHTGAFVAESGIAELLKGERVLSPQLTVSFDRLANVLANFPNIPDRISLAGRMLTANDMERIASNMTDRLISTLERRTGVQIDKLLAVENMNMEDGTDAEILSRELTRQVNALRAARG